jgi:selenocysteine-specific elongation factor
VRLPDHRPTLTGEDREARDRLLEVIGDGGAEPPWVEELADEMGGDVDLLHDLLELLRRESRLVQVSPDLYVAPEVEEELRASAARLVETSGPVPAGEFRDVLGDLSRDYLIAYLEHFDREGVTRRTDDGRVPAQST